MQPWTSPPSSGALTDLLRPSVSAQQPAEVFVKPEPELVSVRPSVADLPALLPPRGPFRPGISDVLRTANPAEQAAPSLYELQQQQAYKHEGDFSTSEYARVGATELEMSRYPALVSNDSPVVSTYSANFMTLPNSTDYSRYNTLTSLSSPSSYVRSMDMTPPGMARSRTRPIGLGMPIQSGAVPRVRPANRTCKFAGCTHYVVDHGLCVRHGGGKRCSTEGCTSRAKHFGRCWRHGGSVECKSPGCPNRAKSRGFCWSHGGGTKCKSVDCEKIAISNGLCWAHGGGKRCIVQGCRKQAYERTDNYCNSHFQQYRQNDDFHAEFS